MDKEQNQETFTYTYSAAQQKEIQDILQKYLPKEPDKMEQLRLLDKSVTRKGTVVSLALGVISALILGIGMCCCLQWAETMLVPGIFIGVIGIIGVCAANPLYNHITKKERERVAPQILKLTEELTQ